MVTKDSDSNNYSWYNYSPQFTTGFEYDGIGNEPIQNVLLPGLTVLSSPGVRDSVLKRKGKQYLDKTIQDETTLSNDNTQVNNVAHRKYNTHNDYKAVNGEKKHAQWEDEHRNLASWSYAASTLPWVVAAAPFALGAGDAAAGTALGQAMTSTLSPLAQLMLSSRYMPYVNAGLSSIFAAHGLNDIMNGKFTPQTAMDIAPLTQLAKPMYNTIEKGFNYVKDWRPFTSQNLKTSIEPKYSKDYSGGMITNPDLVNVDEIPLFMREKTTDNYLDFVGSKDYLNRFKKSGLSDDHYNYMLDIADRRLNDGDFPSHVADDIKKVNEDPIDAAGLSVVDPNDFRYGISLNRKSYEPLAEVLDHETSHWATANIGLDDVYNTKVAQFTGEPNVGLIKDIMKYNESLIPNKLSVEESTKRMMKLNESLTPEQAKDQYSYLIDPQEMRSEAYAVIQQAKREGLSIDEFIKENFNKNGEIKGYASEQLKRLSYVLTIDDIKKFVNNLLSIATPIGVINSYNNSNNSISK